MNGLTEMINAPLEAARRVMWELSTSHMTQRDATILDGSCGFSDLPRICLHDHGYIVFVGGGSPEELVGPLRNITERGLSEAFYAIYLAAATDPMPPVLINFDPEGDVINGLPTFDW
jgi:hypothetical protein